MKKPANLYRALVLQALIIPAAGALQSAMAQTAIPATSGPISDTSAVSGIPGSNRPSQAEPPVGPGGGPIGTAPSPELSQNNPFGAGRALPADQTGPTPIHLGAFTLNTGATAGGFYDDNIFAANRNRQSDVAFFVRPEVSALAQGTDYGVQTAAYVEARKYVHFSSEDQINGGVSAVGVYQADNDTQIRGNVEYLHGHEDRGSSDNVFLQLDKQVAFNQFDGSVALNKRFGRWWTSVGASAVGILYENDSLQGIPIDESYRNVLIPALTGRVGYVVAPLTSLFAEVTGNVRDFRLDTLSSAGYRTIGGLLLEPGPGARVKGEVFGGFIHQDYTGGGGLQTISTYTYGGAMSFLLRDDLAISGDGRREAKESALFGGVSLIESSIGARVDYHLLDNLVLGAGATYLIDSYQGAARVDHYLSPLASVRYTVSKTVTVGVDYRMLDYQNDTGTSTGFRRNVVLASVNAKF